MELNGQFSSDFQVLNSDGITDGCSPLRWQVRLFKRLCQNDIPAVCDLPTGMGKTSVIHLWFLALRYQVLENRPRLPTRLVYVVDRRTVVDQATEIAERIRSNLPGLGLPQERLSVSTLRGQLADNREWTTDPSRRAIIIGTVDMIGSRLLFSGYRSSYKLRPLDAGLLGQDTLLVLDEAHLSGPFEKLIRALGDRGEFQRNQGSPLRVMCMSATSSGNDGEDDGEDDGERFTLECSDLEGDREINPIIQRYEAQKRLTIEPPADKVTDGVIKATVALAKESNARVVVFVRRPGDAGKIAAAIRTKLKGPENAVEVLTGTMRGLERDELLRKATLKRFLDGNEHPSNQNKGPAVLVSTSAGEVGFDLNADHMVCDAAPLDSMIQRLGRVNRRGYGDATVRVFVAKPGEKPSRKGKPFKKSPWESAAMAAIDCLQLLAKNDDGTFNASPKAIDALKKELPEDQFESASSPKPETVELTDILLDSWSLTSVTGRMPGRPPVAPWLRGRIDEEPETTIAWRAELDIDGFDQLEAEDLENWFDAHRVLPHETLSVPANMAREWIVARWNNLADELRELFSERSCVVDRAGLETVKLRNLVEDLEPKGTRAILGATIILPASFAGIHDGLLNEDASGVADVADERGRQRLLRTVVDDIENEEPLVGVARQDSGGMAQFAVELPDDGDARRQLISLVPKRERPEYGTQRQTLQCHVTLVEKYAREIAGRLSLPDDIRQAVGLAAQWHDCGKNRDIWQWAAGRKPDEEPLGKSGGSLRRMSGGYRHEFGSLCEFNKEHQGKIAGDVFDLAMHLIATHHGRGRPHFPKGGFDPLDRAKSPEIGLDTVRRFARLQRKYGYWRLTWLENLLRCADAMASADAGG